MARVIAVTALPSPCLRIAVLPELRIAVLPKGIPQRAGLLLADASCDRLLHGLLGHLLCRHLGCERGLLSHLLSGLLGDLLCRHLGCERGLLGHLLACLLGGLMSHLLGYERRLLGHRLNCLLRRLVSHLLRNLRRLLRCILNHLNRLRWTDELAAQSTLIAAKLRIAKAAADAQSDWPTRLSEEADSAALTQYVARPALTHVARPALTPRLTPRLPHGADAA